MILATFLLAFLLLTFPHRFVIAIDLDVDDTSSVLNAANTALFGMMSLYNGNTTGGVTGKWPYPPYYWWEDGHAWDGLLHYRHFTGDTQYDDLISSALISQLGPAYDFNVPAEAFDEGNDDQAFWVFAALSAYEYGFPDPPAPAPAWLQVSVNAFNDYVRRWNLGSCNGGLKWQYYTSNAGYDYKSSIANACFFQISARLLRITGNSTYYTWVNKIYDWMAGVALIDSIYNVYDGTADTINCSQVDHDQWSYNVAAMLYGSAVLQNYTNASSPWVERTAGFLSATSSFVSPFPNSTDVIFEANCEKQYSCNIDQQSMKAFLVRCLATTSQLAPFTAPRIGEILRASALGAAVACPTGLLGTVCGTQWWFANYSNMNDYTSGLGQELSAMEVFYSLLTNQTSPPGTFSNISIQPEPPFSNTSSASATRPVITPSASARPLYGAQGKATKKHFDLRILLIFGIVSTTVSSQLDVMDVFFFFLNVS